MAPRNPRDIQREVVKDLGEHIRKNRRGLPLLTTGSQSRKEFANKLKVRSEDHVSIFLKPIANPELEDKDASDSDEGSDESSLNFKDEETTNQELLELNDHSIRTEQVKL
jgi:hypothetical protein